MNTKPRPHQGLDSIVLLILLAATSMMMILLVFVPAPSQAASEPEPVTSQAATRTEPEPEPMTNSYSSDFEPLSTSQCPSGYFCLWSGTNYSGSFAKFSYTASYKSITWSSVKSLWNNRSKRSLLYSGSGGDGSVACYVPGARTGSLSGWPSTANSLYVGKTENC